MPQACAVLLLYCCPRAIRCETPVPHLGARGPRIQEQRCSFCPLFAVFLEVLAAIPRPTDRGKKGPRCCRAGEKFGKFLDEELASSRRGLGYMERDGDTVVVMPRLPHLPPRCAAVRGMLIDAPNALHKRCKLGAFVPLVLPLSAIVPPSRNNMPFRSGCITTPCSYAS